jgi:hypothetical protein
MLRKTNDSAILGFWTLHAYEFIPYGGKLTLLEILPKTTFELANLPDGDKERWIVIHYEVDEKQDIKRFSIK